MIDFSEISETIKDFYTEKKVLSIIITVLVVLFFLGLMAFVVQSMNPAKPEEPAFVEAPLIPDQKIISPEGPSIPDGYALTRQPQEKWTKSEAEEYFTVPDAKALQSLEDSNKQLIDEILGATP